jgi:hypothetical protein
MKERNAVELTAVSEENLGQIEGGFNFARLHVPALVNLHVSPLDKFALNPQPLPPRVWASWFARW